MVTLILMPQFDDEGTPGTIVRWLASVGEAVAEGDGLVEIEADKASFELEAFVSGTLLAVVVGAGERAAPHTILGLLGEPGEAIDDQLRQAAGEREQAPPMVGRM